MNKRIVYTQILCAGDDSRLSTRTEKFIKWQKDNPTFVIVSVTQLEYSGDLFIAYSIIEAKK